MKPDAHQQIERFRIHDGKLASDASYGNNGAFMVPICGHGPNVRIATDPNRSFRVIAVIVSDGEGWDHASVSLHDRCPTWDEMAFVKDLLFEPHETAMQLHPPQSEYVNHHPFCLHIWRPQDKRIPLPPSEFVGPR